MGHSNLELLNDVELSETTSGQRETFAGDSRAHFTECGEDPTVNLFDGDDEETESGVCRHGLLPHGSMAASGFNLASATLGAGTLALPSAMNAAGSLVGSLMLIGCCTGTVYSIRLLMMLVERTGYHTYEEMAHRLVGKWFERLTATLIVVFCWGVSLVYVVAMGKILESLHEIDWFPDLFKGDWGRRLLTTLFWALFMLPLSLAKEINSLRYASFVGMASAAGLVAAIVAHSATHGDFSNNVKYASFSLSMIKAMPIFAFSFCCQTNSFEIYAELKNRSVNKMTLTAALSMGTCTLIYIVAGTAGLADFGRGTKGDILDNYGDPTKIWYIAAAVVGISFTLTMAFPVCVFPTRDAILQMIGFRDAYSTPDRVRIALCAGIAFASLIVGLFVPHIELLFDLLGGICGSSLGFIWPPLFVLRCKWWTRQEVGLANIVGAWILLAVGVVFGAGGTIISVYEQFS